MPLVLGYSGGGRWQNRERGREEREGERGEGKERGGEASKILLLCLLVKSV